MTRRSVLLGVATTLLLAGCQSTGPGRARPSVTLPPDPARAQQQARLDAILSGTDFAEPGRAAAHPVMPQTRTRDD